MLMITFTCDDCSKEEQGREVAQPPAPALLLLFIKPHRKTPGFSHAIRRVPYGRDGMGILFDMVMQW